MMTKKWKLLRWMNSEGDFDDEEIPDIMENSEEKKDVEIRYAGQFVKGVDYIEEDGEILLSQEAFNRLAILANTKQGYFISKQLHKFVKMCAEFFKIYDQKKSDMIKQFKERLNNQAVVIRKAVDAENDKKISEYERAVEKVEIYKKECERLKCELEKGEKGQDEEMMGELEELREEVVLLKKDNEKKDKKISLLEKMAEKYRGIKEKIGNCHMVFKADIRGKLTHYLRDYL